MATTTHLVSIRRSTERGRTEEHIGDLVHLLEREPDRLVSDRPIGLPDGEGNSRSVLLEREPREGAEEPYSSTEGSDDAECHRVLFDRVGRVDTVEDADHHGEDEELSGGGDGERDVGKAIARERVERVVGLRTGFVASVSRTSRNGNRHTSSLR